MAQRITQKLVCDIQEVSCLRPFAVYWFDRLGRPGQFVFEKWREYSLEVESPSYYRLPLQSTHTLRGMVAERGTLRQEAQEIATVWAANLDRENAKALDAIRHAQVVFRYDPDATETYLVWRRIYPRQSPANTINERWDRVNEISLTFEYDPIFNL